MKEKISFIAILANVFLAVSKVTVGVLTNSTAILAAGIDSTADIISSVISYFGIKLSRKPADQDHPFGHYKFEVLSGLLITLIIISSGLAIAYEAYRQILSPQPPSVGLLALGVMAVSALVNEIMSRLKIHYGKLEQSLSLLSDGIHSRIDVYTSLAIFAGLLLTPYWVYADSTLALLMAIYIIREAVSLGKEALGSLLDISAGSEVDKLIKSIVESHNIKLTSLKTQKKGSAITANLEINLPRDMDIQKATAISEDLRKKLMAQLTVWFMFPSKFLVMKSPPTTINRPLVAALVGKDGASLLPKLVRPKVRGLAVSVSVLLAVTKPNIKEAPLALHFRVPTVIKNW